MPCDPKPGLWAYLVCVLLEFFSHPLQMAASVLLLASVVTAALLARRRADHRSIAWALGGVWLADVVGVVLAPALGAPGPYVGVLRLAQHLDSARFLVWPMAIQFAVGLTFIESAHRADARSILRISLLPFYGFLLAVAVACYPGLRGAALGRFYACVQTNAALWSLVVIGAWGARRAKAPAPRDVEGDRQERIFSPGRCVASLLVAMAALSLVLGPWWRGLFGKTYELEQVVLVVLYAAVLGVQAWALWGRRCAWCGKTPEGSPLSHEGSCARNGMVFCSTWCSMLHGIAQREGKRPASPEVICPPLIIDPATNDHTRASER